MDTTDSEREQKRKQTPTIGGTGGKGKGKGEWRASGKGKGEQWGGGREKGKGDWWASGKGKGKANNEPRPRPEEKAMKGMEKELEDLRRRMIKMERDKAEAERIERHKRVEQEKLAR